MRRARRAFNRGRLGGPSAPVTSSPESYRHFRAGLQWPCPVAHPACLSFVPRSPRSKRSSLSGGAHPGHSGSVRSERQQEADAVRTRPLDLRVDGGVKGQPATASILADSKEVGTKLIVAVRDVFTPSCRHFSPNLNLYHGLLGTPLPIPVPSGRFRSRLEGMAES